VKIRANVKAPSPPLLPRRHGVRHPFAETIPRRRREAQARPEKRPFGIAPLRYKKLDKGYAIYSVGPNGRDDDRQFEYGDENRDDVVFEVRR
jgi:hypothetical protein